MILSSPSKPQTINYSWTGPRERLAKVRLQQIFSSDDSFATSLLVAAWDLFGPECQEWDPDIFSVEVPAEIGVQISENAKEKLAAALFLLSRDDFYHDVDIFIQICNVLSGSPAPWTDFDPADLFEVAWGINEAMFIYPPENEENPFSEEIKAYIRHVTESEGLPTPVDVLKLGYVGHSDKNDPFASLASDPIAYQAFSQNKYEVAQELVSDLRDRWMELLQELVSLPVRNGELKDLITRLRVQLVTPPASPPE